MQEECNDKLNFIGELLLYMTYIDKRLGMDILSTYIVHFIWTQHKNKYHDIIIIWAIFQNIYILFFKKVFSKNQEISQTCHIEIFHKFLVLFLEF